VEVDRKKIGNAIKSPTDVAQVLIPQMRSLKVEHFKVVHLNIKNRVVKIEDVSVGTVNASIVHPREVFRMAIKDGSASIILAHNHPSGECEPSREDISLTKRLVEVGELVGIHVLDHLIIGDGGYASLKQMGLME
jgi:DNA repair protein RadC